MSGAGKQWEHLLKRWCDTYRRELRARVFKTDPPVRILSRRKGDEFVGAFTADGPPDFVGWLYPGARRPKFQIPDERRNHELMVFGNSDGRAVAFDAKDCDRGRWPFSDLERHQAADLDSCARSGGLAFVALRLQGRCFVLPWLPVGGPVPTHPDARRQCLGTRYVDWLSTPRATPGNASLGLQDCLDIGSEMLEPGAWLS